MMTVKVLFINGEEFCEIFKFSTIFINYGLRDMALLRGLSFG